MFSLLLIIIYLAFISLGLPDSLLGSAWPIMYSELGVPLSYMGVVSMIIAFGTIVSSLMSDCLTKKLGTGLITVISVFMTAAALFGFSVSHSFISLCFWAIPYGVGAGAVDAALNNYVALHYASRHMSWLHCFWGVGASISPYIMGYCLNSGSDWQSGYRSVSVIQIVLTAMLFLTLPLWKASNYDETKNNNNTDSIGIIRALKIKGVPFVLITFFGYCAFEATAGLWASSYLSGYRGVSEETAAKFAAFYYLGITLGRFICGFISDRLGSKRLIRMGLLVITGGLVLLILPIHSDVPALTGLIIIGIGCAPIYPSIIHATPSNFGKENSQSIIGIQMASAYVGTTFMPPIFGAAAGKIGLGSYPFYLLFFAVLMIVMSEFLNKAAANNNTENLLVGKS